MLRYTLRYLALLPLALLAAHFFGFAFGHLVAPLHAQRNPLYVSVVNREPLLDRYGAYLPAALRLDLGSLPVAGDPAIAPVLREAAVASLGLLSLAILLSTGLGLLVGLLAVRDRPPRIAPWLTAAAAVGLATPTFFFGVLGIAFVIMFLIWAPGQVLLLPLEGYGWDTHLVLPLVALMLRPTAQIAQVTAAMMVGELEKQYVVTARSVGNPERRIVWRHALSNALPAVVSTIAGSLRYTAGELIIVETLFYWPGVGRLIAQALIPANSSVDAEGALFLNPPLLAGALVLFAGLFLLVGLAANLAVRALDPRVRDAS